MEDLDKQAVIKALSKLMGKDHNMGAVYFIRHGSTKFNSDKTNDKIRGWIDVPLDEKGHKEAEEAGDELKDKGISKIYSSDLIRAKQTADTISHKTGAPVVSTSKNLRPWDLGVYQGQKTKDVLKDINHHIDNEKQPVENGESFGDFINRFLPHLRAIMNDVEKNNKPVAVVTHYRNTKAIEAWDKHNTVDKEKMKEDGIKPGAIICWKWDGKNWKED